MQQKCLKTDDNTKSHETDWSFCVDMHNFLLYYISNLEFPQNEIYVYFMYKYRNLIFVFKYSDL
jgi:hypothetical protein